MDCAEFMKQMSSYLDGELEEPLQAEVTKKVRYDGAPPKRRRFQPVRK